MSGLGALRRQMFSSLGNPNYRRYFAGQSISMTGTWVQRVAQSWLVFQITGSATQIGIVVGLQSLPMLILGPYGGVVADRVDKRKLMMLLQSMMACLALILGVLTFSHLIELWQIYLLALLLGMNDCFEVPARQSFVLELVGPADLRNAVSLNSVLNNVARAVGPAAAGIIITSGGVALCFLLNAVSFIGVVTSLARLDVSRLQQSGVATVHARGELRHGLRYVRRTPELLTPLLMVAIVGCLAWEFPVVLPVVAEQAFGGDAATYGFLTAAMGAGAVTGGLLTAAWGRTGIRAMIRALTLFGAAMLAATVAPVLWLELLAMGMVGISSVGFLARANSTLQLEAAAGARGRVMSLYAVAVLGSTPIGGPVAGAISGQLSGRGGLALGAVACFVAAALGRLMIRRPGLRSGNLRRPEVGASGADVPISLKPAPTVGALDQQDLP